MLVYNNFIMIDTSHNLILCWTDALACVHRDIQFSQRECAFSCTHCLSVTNDYAILCLNMHTHSPFS